LTTPLNDKSTELSALGDVLYKTLLSLTTKFWVVAGCSYTGKKEIVDLVLVIQNSHK